MSAMRASLIFICAILCSLSNGAENLVPNSSIESGEGEKPTPWRFGSWEASDGNWSDEHAFTGSKSLRVTGKNGGWGVPFPVGEKKFYTLSFRYRAEGGSARVIAFIRDPKAVTDEKRVLLYEPRRAILSDEKGKFADGHFIEGADENGWVLFDAGIFSTLPGPRSLDLLIKLVSDSPDTKLWIDDVQILPVKGEILPTTSAILKRTDNATVWWEDENRKVFPSTTPPSDREMNVIRIDLAKGEWGCFQVVVTPDNDFESVSWTWIDAEDSKTFPSSQITCRRVETIPITATQGPLGETGPTPDPLTDRLPCSIGAGSNQAFWFTVEVPTETSAGTHRQTLALTQNGDEICRVPVEVKVRDFTIPKQPSIDVYSGFRQGIVRRRETGDAEETMERYYRSFFENRTRCAVAPPIFVRLEGESTSWDATRYIEHRKFVRDEFGDRPFFLPVLWIPHRDHKLPAEAAWKERRIFSDASLTALDPNFSAPFFGLLDGLVEKLSDERLYEQPKLRFIDEPDLGDEKTVTGILTLAGEIQKRHPEIQLSLTAAQIHPDLISFIDEWVLHTDAWDRNREQIEIARNAGCRISAYNNATNLVDYEPLRTRLWPWFLKKYEVDGSVSWWGTVCWRGELEDPWTCGEGSSGVMLYPPRTPAEEGPIESVRWELFRQGLQDFECLHLAEQLVEELEQGGKPEAAEAGREAVSSALSLIGKWPKVRPVNDRPYERDVTKIRDAKRALLDAIESMTASVTDSRKSDPVD